MGHNVRGVPDHFLSSFLIKKEDDPEAFSKKTFSTRNVLEKKAGHLPKNFSKSHSIQNFPITPVVNRISVKQESTTTNKKRKQSPIETEKNPNHKKIKINNQNIAQFQQNSNAGTNHNNWQLEKQMLVEKLFDRTVYKIAFLYPKTPTTHPDRHFFMKNTLMTISKRLGMSYNVFVLANIYIDRLNLTNRFQQLDSREINLLPSWCVSVDHHGRLNEPTLSENVSCNKYLSEKFDGLKIFVASLMLSSKYLDDSTYDAKDWSDAAGLHVDLLNKNEREQCQSTGYHLYVDATDFQSYSKRLAS